MDRNADRLSAEESLGEAFGSVARRLRSASMESLARWEVTPSQLRALRVVMHHGGVRLSELAHRLGIAARSATEVVDGLSEKGLVSRSPDPTDRRATLVDLTDRGRELGERMRAARASEAERLFEPLSEADRAQLARILRKLQRGPSTTPGRVD
jgi:DNA-binding MarR family transcriptional regulator